LWARFGATSTAALGAPDQFRPAIFRFARDDFMEQLLGTLTRDPAHLGSLLARPETWRTQPTADVDLVERVVLPRIARSAAHRTALARSKPAVDPVPDTKTVKEQGQMRDLPLKLYHPAHQRFYLVSASLVCGITGLPDRAMTAGGAEQVNFVLRRLLPPDKNDPTTLREFAFIKDGQSATWRRVADGEDAAQLAPGEELLPLFPVTYGDEAQHTRTLWSGLVPVGRREEYMAAGVDPTAVSLTVGQRQSLLPSAAAAPASSTAARMTQFRLEVAEPWKALIRAAYTASAAMAVPAPNGLTSDEDRHKRAFLLNLQWQMQSWLTLLDFADYLYVYLRDVWDAIETGSGAQTLSPARKTLYDKLGTTSPDLGAALGNPPNISQPKPYRTSLRQALKEIRTAAVRSGLEQTDKIYDDTNYFASDWPGFHCLLAGLDAAYAASGAFNALTAFPQPTLPPPEKRETEPDPVAAVDDVDRLTALVEQALVPGPETDAPPLPFALQLRDALRATIGDAGVFVLRCVYQNRDCGPLHPPTLSAPTPRFRLASFFDPDAPARPVRITLPLDTTPAGLRKHSRNTAFIISDILCGQIQRAKGLGLGDLVMSVLPWPLHKDLNVGGGGACKNAGDVNIGMICSLSIPIVTICALILLIIIVSLLDFIFRWIPWFVICFPILGLKGKSGP